jgi:hypothetical protein
VPARLHERADGRVPKALCLLVPCHSHQASQPGNYLPGLSALSVACRAARPREGVELPRANDRTLEEEKFRNSQGHSMDANDINGLAGLAGQPLALPATRAVIRRCEDPLMSKAGKS